MSRGANATDHLDIEVSLLGRQLADMVAPDGHHRFEPRPRFQGNMRAPGCGRCGVARRAEVHRVAEAGKRGSPGTNITPTTCIACGTAISKSALRCKPCSNARMNQRWTQADAVNKAGAAADRREVAK